MSKDKKLEKKIKKLETASTEPLEANELVTKVINAFVESSSTGEKKHKKQKKSKEEAKAAVIPTDLIADLRIPPVSATPQFDGGETNLIDSMGEGDLSPEIPREVVSLERKVEILGNVLYELLTDQLVTVRALRDSLVPVVSEECQKACDAKSRKRGAKPSTPQKKRRMTGYQLFCQHKRHEFDDQKSGPMKMGDLAKLWNQLSEYEKENYRKEAEALPRPETSHEASSTAQPSQSNEVPNF